MFSVLEIVGELRGHLFQADVVHMPLTRRQFEQLIGDAEALDPAAAGLCATATLCYGDIQWP